MRSTLLSPIVTRLSKRSIRTQILFLIIAVTLTGGFLVGYFSLQSRTAQTISASTQWAQSLAALTARTAASPLLTENHLELQNALTDIAALPGVVSVLAARPGGELVMRIDRTPQGSYETALFRDQQGLAPTVAASIEGDRIQVHSSLKADAKMTDLARAPTAQRGWITLTYDFAPNLAQARSAWLSETLLSLGLVALALAFIYRFLNRSIHPILKLAEFATALTATPGITLRMPWGSKEVRALGRALNWSSAELARQIEQEKRRFSRQHAILDTAADAIIGVTAEGLIDSANPAAERMFGLPGDEIVGKPLAHFLQGLDAAALREAMDNGMLIYSTQSRIGRLELNAQRHGGTAFPTEVLLGEIPNDPELRYTCIVRDLSDTKIAEEYLTLYSRVLDCTLNGIFISDARRYPQPIVHVNPAFTRITGYAPHETLGREASLLEGALTDPVDLAILARTVQSGGEATMTLKNYHKDGTLFHNKLSVSPVRDSTGEITHYINVIEDVSSQIEVKQRLIERTARLNATFDLSPDGFAVFDGKGDLITLNPALRNMVGDIPSPCSLPRFDQWMQNLCEDPSAYRSALQARQDQGKDTLILSRPARKVLEREVRQNLGGSGETFFYFRDVTHQYEVDRIKSEFLATAAHELRTPLASILGFTELMLHRTYSEEKRKDLLETVHRQGTLLSNLIQELLDLSRIEARQGKDFHIEPTPLALIVKNAVEGIAGRDTSRALTLGEVPQCHVMADASKIEQALVNLLTNAYKYSPNGGEVRLSVEQWTHQGEEMVAVHIQDQGIGMTPEQLERAFERFYRADGSGNIPGTGLGLNLVKEIADIHGGSVKLSSEYGKGTTATLWLKTAQAQEIAHH